MMSPGGKQTVLVCHPTKRVNLGEELTYLSTNIDQWTKNLLDYFTFTRPAIYNLHFSNT